MRSVWEHWDAIVIAPGNHLSQIVESWLVYSRVESELALYNNTSKNASILCLAVTTNGVNVQSPG